MPALPKTKPIPVTGLDELAATTGSHACRIRRALEALPNGKGPGLVSLNAIVDHVGISRGKASRAARDRELKGWVVKLQVGGQVHFYFARPATIEAVKKHPVLGARVR